MRNSKKLFLLNLAVVVTAVLTYSEGFLALRPTDPSILRAGSAILIGAGLLFALTYGNYRLLSGTGPVSAAQLDDPAKIESALKEFFSSAYLGEYARTAAEQLSRVKNCCDRAELAVRSRFGTDSMTADRYLTVIGAARGTAVENMKKVAVGMSMFDEKEYKRLENYKRDDIPDDIQEKQLELYDASLSNIRQSVITNEQLLLKMDTLALGVSAGDASDNGSDALLGEISELTNELKYYS